MIDLYYNDKYSKVKIDFIIWNKHTMKFRNFSDELQCIIRCFYLLKNIYEQNRITMAMKKYPPKS